MTPQILKDDKEYNVPDKCIFWIVGKHSLELLVKLDWIKYEGGGLILPPDEFGRCKDWHFALGGDALTGTFSANWNIRRVRDKLDSIDDINQKIIPFALDK